MGKVIKLTDEVHEKLQQSADKNRRSMSQEIDYLLSNQVALEDIAESLRQTPTEKKENEKPAVGKPTELQPVRTRQEIQLEVWAIDKRLRNLQSEVQDRAAEESWTDTEAMAYAQQLEMELHLKRDALTLEMAEL